MIDFIRERELRLRVSEVSTIRVSEWDQEDSQDSKESSLTHPLTRMVLTSLRMAHSVAT